MWRTKSLLPVLVALVVAAWTNSTYAQSEEQGWDNILKTIEQSPDDSATISNYLKAAAYRADHFGDSVFYYADLAQELAIDLKDTSQILEALRMKGSYARTRKEYDQAEAFLNHAIEINELYGDLKSGGRLIDNLAGVFTEQSKYDTALVLKLKALDIFLSSNDSFSIAVQYLNLGFLFQEMNEYASSLTYLKKVPYFAYEDRLIAYTYGNMAIAHKQLGHLDSALVYYKKSLAEFSSNHQFVGKSLSNIALLFTKQAKYDSVDLYFSLAAEKFTQVKDTTELATLHMNWAESDLKQGKYSAGIEKCLDNEHTIKRKAPLKMQRRFHQLLSRLYEGNNEHSAAIENYKVYHKLNDSLTSIDLKTRISEIKTQYETVEKEKKILEQEIELSTNRKQKSNLVIGLFFLALSSGVVIYLIAQRAHFRKIKMQQDLQLQEAKIEELNKVQHINTLNATLAGEESERKRIATDLHDSLGALLATVKLHFRNINKHLTAVQELAPFKKASNLLDEAAVEVRRIAHNMMPAALIEFGLIASIEEMVIQLREQGYQVQFDKFGEDERMDHEREMMVYRIFQELIQNIIKHSGARKIIIQYTQDGDILHLIVEDDGRGYDLDSVKSGLGTKSIKSRVKFLDGTIVIDSQKGVGTNVHLTVVQSSEKV